MASISTKSESGNVRSVDRELLSAMPPGNSVSIEDLIEALDVTATAVRQRIERLLDRGLIEREKIVSGRGRPKYRYRITDAGRRACGADSSALAEAMWQELLAIEDTELREQLLRKVASRLGKEYASRLDQNDSLADRMKVLSQLLAERQVCSNVKGSGDLPVLDINACPYPTLADGSVDHTMCRLEEQVLSEALGKPVQLSRCRLDGDECCQFAPAESFPDSHEES
jgi:predicted ArsR family transcriptional regulator